MNRRIYEKKPGFSARAYLCLPFHVRVGFDIIHYVMEEHTLRVLEFDKVIAKLQEQAACTLGREVAALTCPTSDLEAARRKQRQTSEARGLLQAEGSIPLGGIEDIRKSIERAAVEALLRPEELVSILHTLQSSRRLSKFLSKNRQHYPLMGALGREIGNFETVENEIAKAISDTGEVLDSASRELAQVRSRIRTIHDRLTERMNSYLQANEYRNMLQEHVITLRDDRYCVPVKSEFRNQFPGIVHDSSASGATLFIEPAAVVELGNKRKELAVKERDEIEKVLAKFTGIVSNVSEAILAALDAVGMIDCITARAKLGMLQAASEPVLNDTGEIELLGARHPLLKGDVVPIDVSLGKTFDALLITGPNTGGKTVSLKTIGLLALMAASGLHVPAQTGTEVAVFKQVFADIGDEQSIEQSLSTFSSHMNNIVRITEAASENSLILLDEIGAGTDPGEGSALAKAVLDFLMGKGSKIVATTHYGELKEFAYLREGIENASVEFDPETLQPTFRLLIGIPGSSNAFAIAGRLGLDESLINSAKSNLASHAETAEELIRRIEESHKAVAEHQRAAERSSADVEALKRDYEEKIRRLENARVRVEEMTRKGAEAVVESYARKLEATLQQLAEQKKDSRRSQGLKQKTEKLLDGLEKQVAERAKASVPKEQKLPKNAKLAPGMRVRIAGVNQDGEIVDEPHEGKVTVLMGAMRVAVPISSLRKAHPEPTSKPKQKSDHSSIGIEKAKSLPAEVSLRGMRADEALIVLGKYLDDALAAGALEVRIVHGKGTGALRKVVWEALAENPQIASYRLGERREGGSGVTMAKLK